MPTFGTSSESRLITCHPDLQLIMRMGILLYDFKILEGHRIEARQNYYFATGLSKVEWPDGNHNSWPSNAVDIEPYPKYLPGPKGNKTNVYSVKGEKRFYMLFGMLWGIADQLKIPIRWGGDWDKDLNPHDQSWNDLPHVELVKPRPLTGSEVLKFTTIIKPGA